MDPTNPLAGAIFPEDAPPPETSITRDAPEPEEARHKLVSAWQAKVLFGREYWDKRAFKRMREDMAFCAGRQWATNAYGMDGTDDELNDEAADRYVANITLRHVQSRTAAIYGKNPKIVARRKQRLNSTVWDGTQTALMSAMQAMQMAAQSGQLPPPLATGIIQDASEAMARDAQMAKIAKTLELLFEHELDEQPLPFKVQMKSTVRRGLTTGVGYVKLGYQRIMSQRPETLREVAGYAERLARVERMSADMADGETDPNEAEAETLRLELARLAGEEEIVVKEGLTMSFPDSTSLIFDPEMTQLRGFLGASWVAEEYFLTAARIEEIYKVDVKSRGNSGDRRAVAYNENRRGQFQRADGGSQNAEDTARDFHCVWEIYDRDSGQVFVVCEGHPDFLSEPAAPDVWLERFFPWFPFVVNETYDDTMVIPPSDVRLMRDQQKELNRARQGLREHRRAARPVRVTRQGALSTDDKDTLQECKAHEVVELTSLQPGEKIGDVIQNLAGPGVDPNLYDTSMIYDDYQRTLGQSEASLGGTSNATATESSIAESSRLSHVSSVVDDLDEFLTELARAAGQVLLSEASEDRVTFAVGPGAVWPSLSRDEIAREIYLDVEAASTGRPNQQQEIQNAQMIFPMLMQIPGMSPEWLAKEMLRRLDDRLDLNDAFAANMPSIMAINSGKVGAPGGGPGGGADPSTAGTANDPAAQGGQGANNAPSPEPPRVNEAPVNPMPGTPQGPLPV